MPGPEAAQAYKGKNVKPTKKRFEPKPRPEQDDSPVTDPDFWLGSYKDRRMKLEWALDFYGPEHILGQSQANCGLLLEPGAAKVCGRAALRLCRLSYMVKQLKKLVAMKKIKCWDCNQRLWVMGEWDPVKAEWKPEPEVPKRNEQRLPPDAPSMPEPMDDLVHAAWLRVLQKFPTASAAHPDFSACVGKTAEEAGTYLIETRFRPFMDTREKVAECADELAQLYPTYELLTHLELDVDVDY